MLMHIAVKFKKEIEHIYYSDDIVDNDMNDMINWYRLKTYLICKEKYFIVVCVKFQKILK